MKIKFVEIQNFRKLKACRIEIGEEETIFVGANNSGKTSAMDALILFLKKSRHKDITTTDFTLSNWSSINQIGEQWTATENNETPNTNLDSWLPFLPAIDIWIRIDEKDIHRVIHLLPTLDWTPQELVGVRLVLTPEKQENIEKLHQDFKNAYNSAREAESSSKTSGPFLKPISLRDFLDDWLHRYFKVGSYILDPTQCKDPEKGIAKPQALSPEASPLDKEPFDGLIKIDVITAQRGFSDPKTESESHIGFENLSKQLSRYYEKHLDPAKTPDHSDIGALEAIEEAKNIFNDKLKTSFEPAIHELEQLNYPGFSDPRISITSNINPIKSLDHDTAVQFELPGANSLYLPEKYNGLGYQNLISMVFKLISFRDEWMCVGKEARKQDTDTAAIEPLHVVFIEEPEAHLHVQVQQVFIKKAYTVLREHDALKDDSCSYSTQMIVSTHSPHIAHELNFSCLRYFQREPASNKKGDSPTIPTATVVNLSMTFGDQDETTKFATRYLRTTHCDLFFADAAILVEGSAERMLVPHFIRNQFPILNQSYISLLEIGGAHAHRLKPLLETLGLLTLIITDLDSIETIEKSRAKKLPKRGNGYKTRNDTLKNWVPKKEKLEELLDLSNDKKVTKDGLVMATYQCPVTVIYSEGMSEQEAIPYTFEDSLALTNLDLFKGYKNPKGLLKEFTNALNETTLEKACEKMFKNLENGKKAEMALELLFETEPGDLKPPSYISDGLEWLEKSLEAMKKDILAIKQAEVKDA